MRKGGNFSAVILFLAAVTLSVGEQSFYGGIFGAILDEAGGCKSSFRKAMPFGPVAQCSTSAFPG